MGCCCWANCGLYISRERKKVMSACMLRFARYVSCIERQDLPVPGRCKITLFQVPPYPIADRARLREHSEKARTMRNSARTRTTCACTKTTIARNETPERKLRLRQHTNAGGCVFFRLGTRKVHLENDSIGSDSFCDLALFQAECKQLRLPWKVDAVAIRMSHLSLISAVNNIHYVNTCIEYIPTYKLTRNKLTDNFDSCNTVKRSEPFDCAPVTGGVGVLERPLRLPSRRRIKR